jgi:uncharacterized protein YdeI (YjbR/CyaY-like superfamily)
MIEKPAPRLFKTRAKWRAWLEKNHDKNKGLWLAYYKKNSGKSSVSYEEALEEALCFGWIDSTVNRLDDERYMQKWTPRNEKSIWSAANKARVKKLIAEGKMAPSGLAKVAAAKRNGSWTKIDRIELRAEVPEELLDALALHPSIEVKFNTLAPSQKKLYSWWIESAKRPETRARRIAETLKRVEAGRPAGM